MEILLKLPPGTNYNKISNVISILEKRDIRATQNQTGPPYNYLTVHLPARTSQKDILEIGVLIGQHIK